jgi:hypothetical protein
LYLAAGVTAARALRKRHVVSGEQALGDEVGAVAAFARLPARFFAPVRPRRAAVVRGAAVVVRRIPPLLKRERRAVLARKRVLRGFAE